MKLGPSFPRWLVLTACLPAAVAAQGNHCIVRTPSLQVSYTGDCVAGYASGCGRAVGAADHYEASFLNFQVRGMRPFSAP